MLFFEADAVAVKKPPNRPKPCLLLPFLEQPGLDLLQRRVRLLPHHGEQPFFVLLQRREALPLGGLGFIAARFPASASPNGSQLNPQSQTVSPPPAQPHHPRLPGSLERADRSNTPSQPPQPWRRPPNLIRDQKGIP